MRKAYQVLGFTIAGCVVLQATWIALATFLLIGEVDDGKIIDKDYEGNFANGLHAIFGMMIIPLLAIILLIVAFLAKIDGGVKRAAFVLLAVVVQIFLGFLAFGIPELGFLHPINAFVVLGLALNAARQATVPSTRVAEAAPAV